jgi:tetratricopeptide (TPR) repeat protein
VVSYFPFVINNCHTIYSIDLINFVVALPERKGDYDLAVQCLQDSLSGRQENLDEMDSEIAENLARLGHVYSKKSNFDLAVTVFSDCLKIREATRGTDAASKIHVADALFDLGTALQKTSDTQRSMQLFTDALKEYQRHSDNPNDLKIAKCHSCIGEIYEKTNELMQAVNELGKSLDALVTSKGFIEFLF